MNPYAMDIGTEDDDITIIEAPERTPVEKPVEAPAPSPTPMPTPVKV